MFHSIYPCGKIADLVCKRSWSRSPFSKTIDEKNILETWVQSNLSQSFMNVNAGIKVTSILGHSVGYIRLS